MEMLENQLESQPPAAEAPEPAMDAHALAKDLPRIGTGLILLMILAFGAMLAGLYYLGWHPRLAREAQLLADAKAADDPRPIVDTIKAKRATVASELMLPADVRAMQDTFIYPRANGYLKKLLVDIGDTVKEGQLLAEIDAPDIDAELNQSRAALDQAKANAAKAKADMELADSTLKRFQELAKKELVSAQQIEEKDSAYSQAVSAHKAAEASIAAAQAAIQRLTTLQNFERVTAPFSGTITTRNYDIGALLSSTNTGPGRELFRLNQTDPLRVFVNVPQSYVSNIRVGQPADLMVRNYPGRVCAGKVARWSGAVDSATRTMKCEIHVPNTDKALYPGMYGQVKFPILQDRPPLLVPTSALMNGADGTRVITLTADNKAHYAKVILGRDLGTQIEIVAGLEENQQVVSNPDEQILEGAEVRPVAR